MLVVHCEERLNEAKALSEALLAQATAAARAKIEERWNRWEPELQKWHEEHSGGLEGLVKAYVEEKHYDIDLDRQLKRLGEWFCRTQGHTGKCSWCNESDVTISFQDPTGAEVCVWCGGESGRASREFGETVRRLNLTAYPNVFDPERGRCHLYKDFAPFSFGFGIEVRGRDGQYKHSFSGGLIYHGEHDGFGSGSAPTFSVCLESTNGWSIHT